MINYGNLNESVLFYEKAGYTRIESPWTVTPYISELTKPEGLQDYEIIHNHKVLVASGEQSFLYLYLKEFLPLGKFQTITPCFRDDIFDYWHSKYFMKNELIITDKVSKISLDEMISNAFDFFSQFFPNQDTNSRLNVVNTSEGRDIVFKYYDEEIELGSYGIRENSYLKWIYGTGCAEPRLSKVIKLANS